MDKFNPTGETLSTTFTEQAFDYVFPVDKDQANHEREQLERTINQLEREAKATRTFWKL